MSIRFLSLISVSLGIVGTLLVPAVAWANVPLTYAEVRNLRRQVDLILQGQTARPAQVGNGMNPGDALRTGQQSMAELRFNDRSLARIGERAMFRFIPNTRNFYLNNGTALLLIPPGRGRTQIQTPNSVAGIRGSALFVRYSSETNVTIVGALTNSQIEVSTNNGSPPIQLLAGQMAVVHQNQISLYNFDLKNFYQTSPIVQDLNLASALSASGSTVNPDTDADLDAVRQETVAGLTSQPPLSSKTEPTPAWTRLYTATAPINSPQPIPYPALQSGVNTNLSEGMSPPVLGDMLRRGLPTTLPDPGPAIAVGAPPLPQLGTPAPQPVGTAPPVTGSLSPVTGTPGPAAAPIPGSPLPGARPEPGSPSQAGSHVVPTPPPTAAPSLPPPVVPPVTPPPVGAGPTVPQPPASTPPVVRPEPVTPPPANVPPVVTPPVVGAPPLPVVPPVVPSPVTPPVNVPPVVTPPVVGAPPLPTVPPLTRPEPLTVPPVVNVPAPIVTPPAVVTSPVVPPVVNPQPISLPVLPPSPPVVAPPPVVPPVVTPPVLPPVNSPAVVPPVATPVLPQPATLETFPVPNPNNPASPVQPVLPTPAPAPPLTETSPPATSTPSPVTQTP